MIRRTAFGGGKWRTGLGLSLLLCAWVCGCDVTGLPHGARGFAPPEQYRAWWALTEACSGVQGTYSAVKWYILPRSDTFSLGSETVNGAWYGGHANFIVLGDAEEFDGSLVRHEMLHALLKNPGHPRQQFLGNCSDIVACVEDCVTDGGGPPDTSASAPLLGPSVLPAAILLAPNPVSLEGDSGWTTIPVTLTNTTAQRARAAVTTFDSMPRGVVVYFADPRLFGGDEIFFDYYMTLAAAGTAGSTRRMVFDYQAPASFAYQQFVITGNFGESAAPGQTLTVVP
jgi:hypothetical protein